MTPCHCDPSTDEQVRPPREECHTVLRGGIRWFVRTMGAGPALLLLHGTGSSSHTFRDLMPLLANHFTVVAPDLPGHASTTAPAWFEPSLPIMAAAVDELLEGIEMAPVLAVGHSAGAAILTRMVLDGSMAPELLVGLGPALVPFSALGRMVLPPAARVLSVVSKVIPIRAPGSGSVDRVLRSTGSFLDGPGIEFYRRLAEQPSHVTGVLSMMANWELTPLFDELPLLRVPLLLVGGEQDRATPLAQLKKVASRVKGARVVDVAGAGHLVHEEVPATVARLVLQSVKDLKAGAALPCDEAPTGPRTEEG